MTSSNAEPFELRGAVHAGDDRAGRLGQLDGERPDAAAGTVDQHLLARLHLAAIGEALEREDARLRHGRRLLERQARGHRRQRVLARADVLAEPTPAGMRQVAEDPVTGPEAGHARTDGFDHARDVRAHHRVAWFAPHGQVAPQEIPVPRVDGGRVDLQEHVVVALDARLRDLREPKHVG